jgi:hypothetical protein
VSKLRLGALHIVGILEFWFNWGSPARECFLPEVFHALLARTQPVSDGLAFGLKRLDSRAAHYSVRKHSPVGDWWQSFDFYLFAPQAQFCVSMGV